MAPVARGLSDLFQVLEPFQRGSGNEPLTVARHVADLHALVESVRAHPPPALVGHSWGAMLALAYTAEHCGFAGPLVLIACGTFDSTARQHLRAPLEHRMSDALRQRLGRLAEEFSDPDERLRAMGDLLAPLYSYDLGAAELENVHCDARAYDETWMDMLRLQEEGVYPSAFRAVKSRVLMLQGTDDPHPGRLIRASLQPYLSRLEYREIGCCGHYPWLERTARAEFFAALREWLTQAAG